MIKEKIHFNDTVIFDVDDTLGHFTRSFDTWLADYFCIDLPDRNIFPDYNLLAPFKDHLPLSATAVSVLEAFERTGRIQDPVHFIPTSVVDLAKRLQKGGCKTIALTARAWMKDGQKTTADWLASLGIPMPVHVLGLKDSKAKWINDQINAGNLTGKIWMFEDNPHHIEDIAYTCTRVETPFVVDHPHNRHLSPTTFHRRVDPNSSEWISSWPN